MAPIRCGDHVFHKPTGEKWLVAYVDEDRLAWCGWPPGEAKLSDCELIKSCSDEEHLELLKEISSIRHQDGDKRTLMAREAMGKLAR